MNQWRRGDDDTKRVKELEAALRFYADDKHYALDGLHSRPYILLDRGETARKALGEQHG